jgi:hypothetical protein
LAGQIVEGETLFGAFSHQTAFVQTHQFPTPGFVYSEAVYCSYQGISSIWSESHMMSSAAAAAASAAAPEFNLSVPARPDAVYSFVDEEAEESTS